MLGVFLSEIQGKDDQLDARRRYEIILEIPRAFRGAVAQHRRIPHHDRLSAGPCLLWSGGIQEGKNCRIEKEMPCHHIAFRQCERVDISRV